MKVFKVVRFFSGNFLDNSSQEYFVNTNYLKIIVTQNVMKKIFLKGFVKTFPAYNLNHAITQKKFIQLGLASSYKTLED
jgi:hypothetical protein